MRALLLINILGIGLAQVRTPYFGSVRLDGAVLDSRTNAPIVGANVTPATRFGQFTTDLSGRFSVEFPRRNDSTVTITNSGYVTAIAGCVQQAGNKQETGHCENVVVRLVRMGTVTGRVVDLQGRPAAKASVTLASLNFGLHGGAGQTDERGLFQIEADPGPYVICARSRPEIEREFGILKHELGVTPVSRCYRSAIVPEEAEGVTLTSGEITGPLTIRLGEARLFAIRGRLHTWVRKTKSWYATIWAVPDASADEQLEGEIDARTGGFRIPALRAGMYTIVAMAGEPSGCDTCGGGSQFFATARVKVQHDIHDLSLDLRPKATVSGKMVIMGESNSGIEEQPVELDSRLGGGLGNSLRIVTGPDQRGRFEFTHVAQGVHRLRAGTYPRYEIATVHLNGKQLDPDSFAVTSTSVSGLRIALRTTDALLKPVLSFPVTDWSSQNYWVIAIPETDWQNWERWIESRIESPTTVLGPMPAGAYLVLLIDTNDSYSMENCADEIRLHRREAVRVVLKNGRTETVALRPIRVD
jgi:hypothetical protein